MALLTELRRDDVMKYQYLRADNFTRSTKLSVVCPLNSQFLLNDSEGRCIVTFCTPLYKYLYVCLFRCHSHPMPFADHAMTNLNGVPSKQQYLDLLN